MQIPMTINKGQISDINGNIIIFTASCHGHGSTVQEGNIEASAPGQIALADMRRILDKAYR